MKALPQDGPMLQKLLVGHGTAEADEELAVTLHLDRFVPFDLVISAGADMRFCAERINADTRYFG